jgi:hypothetical protein
MAFNLLKLSSMGLHPFEGGDNEVVLPISLLSVVPAVDFSHKLA